MSEKREQDVAKQMLAAVQAEKAMRMRVKGAHWREVADACGYSSPAAALKAVGEAMKAASLRAEMTADEMRTEATLRLESLLSSAIEMIEPETFYGEKGQELDDRAQRIRAVATAQKIIMAMAKLNGIDKPEEEQSEEIPTVRIIGIDPSEII